MRRRSLVGIGVALAAAVGLVLAAVLTFPTGNAGRFASGRVHVPLTLELSLFTWCSTGLDQVIAELDAAEVDASEAADESLSFSFQGSGGTLSVTVEAPGFWRIDANRAGVTLASENGDAGSALPPPLTPASLSIARHMYTCLAQYRFVDQTGSLASSSQLVQWYKYDTTVLWPCLAAHGFKVGDPPSREDFADAFRAQSVDPFSGLTVSTRTLPRLLEAVQDCPVRPSYLR